ncbi:hypothetical protein [[Phormidium] sp. ETS-05]|uniref:hypothetical protein n=1 Tax=[Phormidium] sp. ETS-05 TaxID=222819 RepID=UPI0018EF0592|nr:hypothetical protein [[Phormidium] sp. ETS-05]
MAPDYDKTKAKEPSPVNSHIKFSLMAIVIGSVSPINAQIQDDLLYFIFWQKKLLGDIIRAA